MLARDYSPAPEAVTRSAAAYQADPSPRNLSRLQESVESPRQELFRRLNMAPGGTAALVEMRKQLLKDLRANPEWQAIDADLLHLLRSWFNRGFLRLERIDWRTPAIVLEKLIEYEAVHAMQGWRDLRRRLEADRRCFAFFHPQLPDEPIIFIEVALTRSMSAQIQPLLDIGAPVDAGELRLRDVLLDHQLPGRAARHLLRQPADQAGGGGAAGASSRTCAASPRCRRFPAFAAGWTRRAREQARSELACLAPPRAAATGI